MNNTTIYIAIPKNTSYSVFEALKTHTTYFKQLGYNVVYLSRSKNIPTKRTIYFNSIFGLIYFLFKKKRGIVYCPTVFEVWIAKISNIIKNKKQIIFWVQGLIDDEDYLNYKKKWRYYLYHFLLKKSLQFCDKTIVVTNKMVNVLTLKYGLDPKKKYLVLNCNSRLSFYETKKIKNSLCYIGGLSKWQNVDKILIFFNMLAEIKNDYTLYIATFNHEDAKELIQKHVNQKYTKFIKLVSVKTKNEVETFLNKMEFGFLIRDNIPLNNVASPIKLAEYLSCGVNPIISESLTDFEQLITKHQCGVVIKKDDFKKAILELTLFKPNTYKATKLYTTYFEADSLLNRIKFFINEN